MSDGKYEERSKMIAAVFEGIGEVISGLFGLAVFLIICAAIFLWGFGDGLNSGEREGTVSYEDCREKIPMTEQTASFKKMYQSFTCEYDKTEKGRIRGGTCVHIEYEKNQGCKAAYIYKKLQDKVCTDPKFPQLGVDDRCYPGLPAGWH